MKKLVLLALVIPLAACSKEKTDSAATSGSASPTLATATATTTATTPSLVDKALTFLTGGPFEGEITMNMTSGDRPPQTITYMVKGKKMRFDTPRPGAAGDSYAIFDGDTKKMITVTDSKKSAFEIDMNADPAAAAHAAAAPKPTVENTGKSDTVAGYSCDIWKISEASGDKTDACLAKGIAFPMMSRSSPSWVSELGGENFPLRVVTTDATGKEKSKMEVTKIEKKTIDDAKMQVPAGYKTMSMGDMMKSLGGMHGMHGMPH